MEALINRVIEHMKEEMSYGDLTAIAELLTFCPFDNLIEFLPEEEWENYR